MDKAAESSIICLHQFKTNERFLTFIAIVKDLKEVHSFMQSVEEDTSCTDDNYKFELFHQAYLQCFMRFSMDDYIYYKYYMRFLLYEVQVDYAYVRPCFINFPRKGQYETEPLIATSSFYYMVLYSFENVIKFLNTLKCDAATNILKLFTDGSFLTIIEIMKDLWYIPKIKDPPLPQLLNLQKIDKLSRINRSEFDKNVQLLLDIKSLLKPVIKSVDNFKSKKVQPVIKKSLLVDSFEEMIPKLKIKESGQFIFTPERKPRKILGESPFCFDQSPIISRQLVKQAVINKKFDLNTSLNYSSEMSLLQSSVESIDSKSTLKPFAASDISTNNETHSQQYCSSLNQRGDKIEFKCNGFSIDDSHEHESSELDKGFIDDTMNSTTMTDFFSPTLVRESGSKQRRNEDMEIPFVCTSRLRTKFKDTPQKVQYNTNLSHVLNETVLEEDDSDIGNQSAECIDKTFTENVVNFRFRNYTLLKLLGEGSYSKVFEASVEGCTKTYAIKVLIFDLNQPKENVINEINLMKIMENTGKSISIIESHFSTKGAIIIMEKALIDMKQFFSDHMDIADQFFVAHYWRSMMQCVRALHDNNIAHLDLKLQNFVITENLRIKIIDYGISRIVPKDCETITSESVGTIVFMSPELLLNEGVIKPFKCDIWSMGVVLYTMIFDRQPVIAASFEEYVQKLIQNNCVFEMPSSIRNCDLLTEIMERCIQRNPSNRLDAPQLLKLMEEWIA